MNGDDMVGYREREGYTYIYIYIHIDAQYMRI